LNENTIIEELHAKQENMAKSVFDVVIVGGGPVGSYTASIIAKTGYSVLIIEEHEAIGEPVQCAGLITPRVFDIVNFADSSIINRLKGAHIHSPEGQRLTVDAGETRAVVIDRAEFDTKIIHHAQNNGAELMCGSKATGISLDANDWNIKVKENQKEITVTAKLLIGADGSGSRVRGWLGLHEPEFMLNGYNAAVDGLDVDNEYVHIFVGENVAPNFFAWMIPAESGSRVGLCTRDAQEPVYRYFKRLFNKGLTKDMLQGTRVSSESSGRIPLGLLDRTYTDKALLVGDAAAQVKATSGGGIYMGLACAQHCARTVIESLEKDDLSKRMLASYQTQWMNHVGDELKHDMIIHKIYSSMTDKQLCEAFELLDNEEILEMINRIGDIDYPSKLGWALLKKEPRFLKYAGKFLKYRLG
jgi:geranylgeranyl reductase family protein